jgi:hypothetical protein
MVVTIIVFWNIEEINSEDEDSRFFLNTGKFVPHYMTSHSRIMYSENVNVCQ